MIIHDKDIYYKYKTHYLKIFQTWMKGPISVMSTSPASPNRRKLGQIIHRFRQFLNHPSDALKFKMPLNFASLTAWA